MIEGINIEFAQCVMDASEPAINALRITVGCVFDVAQNFRESASGFNIDNPTDLDVLQNLPFSTLPKTDLDPQVTAALKAGFEEAGLNWNATTIDRLISDIEFLQKEVLDDAKLLTEQGVDVTTFQPTEVHMNIARITTEALGITADTFADMQIAGMKITEDDVIDFDQFERLVAMKNMLDANDATAAANWAPSIVASAPPTTSVASLDPNLAQPTQP